MSDCPMQQRLSQCFPECAWWMGGKCAKVRQVEALERIALYLNPAAEHSVIRHEIHCNLDGLSARVKKDLETNIRRTG